MPWAITPLPALVLACWRGVAMCLGRQVQVAREAVGPEGRVVPQQWLANTTAPGVAPLDLVVYGDTPNALCCDAKLVSALTRNGQPAHAADFRDGAATLPGGGKPHVILSSAQRRAPATMRAQVGGRWSDEAQQFARQLVRLRGRPRAARLARSSCAGLGAPLVAHSGCRGPACSLQLLPHGRCLPVAASGCLATQPPTWTSGSLCKKSAQKKHRSNLNKSK